MRLKYLKKVKADGKNLVYDMFILDGGYCLYLYSKELGLWYLQEYNESTNEFGKLIVMGETIADCMGKYKKLIIKKELEETKNFLLRLDDRDLETAERIDRIIKKLEEIGII